MKLDAGELRELFGKPLGAVNALFSRPALPGADRGIWEESGAAALLPSLLATVIVAGDTPTVQEIELFRSLAGTNRSEAELERMTLIFCHSPRLGVDEALKLTNELSGAEKLRLASILVSAAESIDHGEKARLFVEQLAVAWGIEAAVLKELFSAAALRREKRRKIIKSGAGILIALIVLAIFILTATLLRSVIFGLILAYVMLPVEKFFERKLASGHGLWPFLLHAPRRAAMPMRTLVQRLRGVRVPVLTKEQQKKAERRMIVSRAVSLSSLVLLLLVLALGIVVGSAIHRSAGEVRNKVVSLTSEPASAPAPAAPKADKSKSSTQVAAAPETGIDGAEEVEPKAAMGRTVDNLLTRAGTALSNLQRRFEAFPPVRGAIAYVSRVLSDPEAHQELIGMLLNRTGGIVSMTTGMVRKVIALLADLLLTVFFFLLFLGKLAEFCGTTANDEKRSEYLIKTIFNGNWLPGVNEDSLADGQRIIAGMIGKLRVWVKGFLTLVVLDAFVYSIVFLLLGIPYAPVLGILAGLAILLPYIGPLLAMLTTVFVTLAVQGGGTHGWQIGGVVLCYLIYNGVIEQFITYPAVIGESLGLTTLETIIVVLLGGIFFGISGMIFAMPAAAILKYLIPQVYGVMEKS
ncbi:MAG: AI-2E family transporter [Victivallaceae bacterium]|nr:AI-2E family transporter [Victivallaceae bacterium]